MTGKAVNITNEQAGMRPRRGPRRVDSTAQTQGLDRLREAVLSRLQKLESFAAEKLALSELSPSDREGLLRDRVATLEAALARVQAELKRRELEWRDLTEEIESDRKLLSEAWQRLETEQARGGGPHPAAAAVERAAENGPAYRPPQTDDSNDPVTKQILRQFQALQGDVRRNAKGRGSN